MRNQSVAKVLLDAGADVNAREIEFQGTPLATAVRSCCIAEDPKHAEQARKMIDFLIKRGAKVDLPGDKPWATPLAWARRYGHDDLAEILTATT